MSCPLSKAANSKLISMYIDSGMYESKSSLISAVGIQGMPRQLLLMPSCTINLVIDLGAPLPKWTEEQVGVRTKSNLKVGILSHMHRLVKSDTRKITRSVKYWYVN